ncbi:hypothetical protein [Umezakia ovalisporum]|uniref:hypothetical protein n=1 Tax=Umezakia ovalisporum TaxID=75695 RepID=UPI0039C5C653
MSDFSHVYGPLFVVSAISAAGLAIALHLVKNRSLSTCSQPPADVVKADNSESALPGADVLNLHRTDRPLRQYAHFKKYRELLDQIVRDQPLGPSEFAKAYLQRQHWQQHISRLNKLTSEPQRDLALHFDHLLLPMGHDLKKLSYAPFRDVRSISAPPVVDVLPDSQNLVVEIAGIKLVFDQANNRWVLLELKSPQEDFMRSQDDFAKQYFESLSRPANKLLH